MNFAKHYYRKARHYLAYIRWCRRGGGIPVPGLVKQRRILKLAKQYHCSTFVETGTFHGEMVESVYKHFQRVLSVELLESLFEENKARFRGIRNISLFHGKSEQVLPEMIRHIQGQALFWLDAHYSGPGTGGKDNHCPILLELDAIRQARERKDCLVVDDARCFDGTDGYPSRDFLEKAIRKINPSYNIYLENDALIAVPT